MITASDLDRQENEKIKKILRYENQYETKEEEIKKKRILGKLQEIIEQWI